MIELRRQQFRIFFVEGVVLTEVAIAISKFINTQERFSFGIPLIPSWIELNRKLKSLSNGVIIAFGRHQVSPHEIRLEIL
jgi:hypothetical protein